MRNLILAGSALALAACAQPAQKEAPKAAAAPQPPGEIVLQVSKIEAESRALMHELAARCWLDGIVQGAQLIIKPDGNFVIVGDTQDLVTAEYAGLKGAGSGWRISGTVLEDRERTRQLVQSVDRADSLGEIACPPVTG